MTNNFVGSLSRKRKTITKIIVTLFLTNMLTLAFNFQPAKVSGYKSGYVNGIDVSHYQGDISLDKWKEIYDLKYRFSFVKATEGATISDIKFPANMDNGFKADLKMGPYHLGRPEYLDGAPDLKTDALNEAVHFRNYANVWLWKGGLPPALDIERSTADKLTKEQLSEWVLTWMRYIKNYIQEVSGKSITPIIYVHHNSLDKLNETVTQYPLWILHYGVSSPDIGEWSRWRVWQYTDSGSVAGISPIDEDVMQREVGGVIIPVDKFGLLAPYVGLASTIIVATVATVIYVKRVKHRKEKQ